MTLTPDNLVTRDKSKIISILFNFISETIPLFVNCGHIILGKIQIIYPLKIKSN